MKPEFENKECPLCLSPLNVYIFSWEGLCMSERQGSISHEPIVGLTIEELAVLQPNLIDRFRHSQKGEGVSWVSNTNNVQSFAGFIPLAEDRVIVGYSVALKDEDEAFLKSNEIYHLPPNW